MALMNRRRRRRMKRRVPIERRLADRDNPLEHFSDDELFARFRFRAETIMFIVGRVYGKLEQYSRRSGSLPVLTQVLVTLRFLATGSFYSLIADSMANISTTSVYRSVRTVCACLSEDIRKFVHMPSGTAADKTKEQYFRIQGNCPGQARTLLLPATDFRRKTCRVRVVPSLTLRVTWSRPPICVGRHVGLKIEGCSLAHASGYLVPASDLCRKACWVED